MKRFKNRFSIPEEYISRSYNEVALPDYRTEFMRDRDRIMYATAFRRLSGKTQIYTVGLDDHKRNRLTHTLEVAQIARTIASALSLNSNLAEAIALGHDLGHTPFGHAGERTLHGIMLPNSSYIKKSPYYKHTIEDIEKKFDVEVPRHREYQNFAFGFKHNLQSVRVAATLEDSYQDFNGQNAGLNLTNYTLYGMMIHSKIKYMETDPYPNYHMQYNPIMMMKNTCMPAWSFEAYIVEWADEFAQWHHDLEDAIRGGALPLSTICEKIKLSFGNCMSDVDSAKLNSIRNKQIMDKYCIAVLSHVVINTLVTDLIQTSKKNFNRLSRETSSYTVAQLFENYDKLGVSKPRTEIITISSKIHPEVFKNTIRRAVHHSRDVERMNAKGEYIIRKLFEAYYAHPQQLPDGAILHILADSDINPIQKLKENGIGYARTLFDEKFKNPNIYQQSILMRRICDHIACMTDRYALDEYNKLYG